MEIGNLRHRVTLQSNLPVQDPESGSLIDHWTEVAQVWASVAPLSAREFIAAQAEQSAVTTRITIRYRPGISAAMRIVYDGRIFNIAGVVPDARSGREYLTLPCSDGVNNG